MVDPISVLPFETITKIFALLSTPNLAISGSTSREWRSQILTDPIINKVIDLQGLSLNAKETIELVDRLVSLSTDPDLQVGKELHLDLDRFSKAIEDNNLILPDEDNTYASLLKTISSSTKGQLSKLFLDISDDETISGEALTNVMTKTASMLDGPLFKEIHWVAPCAMSATSKHANNSRVFSVETHPHSFSRMEASTFRIFLAEMVRFAGGGLTKLSIDLSCLEFNNNRIDLPGGFEDILYEIQKSQHLMEDLDLSVSLELAFEVFQLVESFKCLSSLRLKVGQHLPGHFSLPKGSMSCHLNKLDLSFPQTTVKMGWLVGWIGRDLESLRICFSLSTIIITKLPKTILSSILRTCLSLKSLYLSGINILNDSSSFQPLTLSNLESLSIGSLNPAGYEIFAKCSMPKLQSLSFNAGERGFVDKETASQVMEHLFTIVERCGSTLAKLSLEKISQPEILPSSEPQNVSKIALPKLKELIITSSDITALQFLQGFKFQLSRLFISGDPASIQSIYELFLEPSSQTLEDVSLSGVGKGVTLSEAALTNIKNNKMSFPKLKSLCIGSGNIQDLVEIFAGATFGELTDLELGNSSNLPFPKSVASLLATSAASLARLFLLDRCNGLYQESDFDGPGLEFANLVNLSIIGVAFSPLQLLLKSSFPKLSKVYIDCPEVHPNSSQAQVSIRQVLNLLESCSSTIKDVTLYIKHFDKTENFRHQFSFFFPKLSRFSSYRDIDFLAALAGTDRPSLLALGLGESFQNIEEKLAEIAPRLIEGIRLVD